MAERARAELAGARPSSRRCARRRDRRRSARCSGASSSSSTGWPSSRAARARSRAVHRRSPERMIGHVAVRIAEVDAVGIERRAQRAAGVARRRRHEHALESGLGEDPRIGDAVERHAAAEAEVRQAGLAVQRARDVDQDVLEHALHAGGAVGEAPALGASRGRSARSGCAAARTDRRIATNTIASAVVWNSKYSRSSAKAPSGVRRISLRTSSTMRRPAVGGEAHHLVFVFVHREAEIGGERRVEHAERMREPDLAQQRDVGARRPARRSPWPTVSVAHSPTPSAVRIAARRVGAVRKAAAACDSWCSVNRIFFRGTPRCDEMMPRTQTFSPSEFFIACGNDRHDRGKRAQRAGQDALELQHAALVEDDRVEIVRLEPGVTRGTIRWRRAGKAASFFRRDSRSSWTAQTGTPSTTSAAAES